MSRKIRVAAVSYLNAKPLIYGFQKGLMNDEIELLLDHPANLAAMLADGSADIALMPVAAISAIPSACIIGDHGIAAAGEVASVCLFSNVPIEEISEIFLDYQSRSSVALLKILLKRFWKVSPSLLAAAPGFEETAAGTSGALIIGDRAFAARRKYSFVYDLAGAWQEMTGLPFVFAAWVSNEILPQNFAERFNETTGLGLQHLPEIIEQNQTELYDLETYYRRNIVYRLGEREIAGMQLFLDLLKQQED